MPEASGVGNNALKEYVDDKTKLEVMKGMMLQIVYPVGSIYMSTANVSPAVFLGGTWSPLDQGRVLIGAGSAYPAGEEGGEEKHTLSEAEMPEHSHSGSLSGGTGSEGNHSHTLQLRSTSVSEGLGNMYPYDHNDNTVIVLNYQNNTSEQEWVSSPSKVLKMSSEGSHSHSLSGASITTSSEGSGAAHNNMQPYLSVYMWKRTA